jgi:hypothetical protein
MVIHMKTTLIIDDQVMRRLKAEAARQGRTLSQLVEAALRLFLERRPAPPVPTAPLPMFQSRALVDLADREALYRAMEGR